MLKAGGDDDLDADRRERGFGRDLVEPYEGWQDITLPYDPDDREQRDVRGKMQLVIASFVDVALQSLNPDNPDKERHHLVPVADHSKAVEAFKKVTEGAKRTFLGSASKGTLEGLGRQDVTILYYTSASQIYIDTWPRTYAVGYDNLNNTPIMAWARTIFAKFGMSSVNDEINEQRIAVGQEPITTVARRRR
ncbi:hypothetical protein M406DRAFT_328588 [Cryphonectria parasitica EP155]|uniref:Uncharacterized protein n=1 Tax=Cryphonectria parasitica (strain ATCC 38755 / EP155) TaxID=660469 RepID=A0A9P4Y5U3_CRYP1|nr:uncharacterized protein M406DRAFT_328588 [Cryphonectria parasitica EP155]KAF3767514.1 hypothetical protein M406DRAFT_328588 [Cryphonectria parasitica EP155]